jgi:periplasmic divalent cation tolerance protein
MRIMSALVVYVTVPVEAASGLARTLVEERVAACVNIIPSVRSVYRWQDAVQEDHEALLVIKTAADRFEPLKAAILRHHPYELPEVLAVSVSHAHSPYLQWLIKESTPSA